MLWQIKKKNQVIKLNSGYKFYTENLEYILIISNESSTILFPFLTIVFIKNYQTINLNSGIGV